jgi:hypothetical protein
MTDRCKYVERAMQGFERRVEAGKVRPPRQRRRKPTLDKSPPTEAQEQARLCQWLSSKGVAYFAVPNGAYFGVRDPIYGSRLKRAGVRPGVPDLILIKRAPDGRPIAIELKRSVGGRLTKHQKRQHELMRKEGWHVLVGHGAEDAVGQVKEIFQAKDLAKDEQGDAGTL